MEDFEQEVVCFMHTCARSGDRIPVCFVRGEAGALMEKVSVAAGRNAPPVADLSDGPAVSPIAEHTITPAKKAKV